MNVQEILGNITQQNNENYKSISLKKDIELDLDLGNLLALDSNPLDKNLINQKTDEYLGKLARENTQILFNELWKLPIERVKDALTVKLPEPTTILPREKKIPKPKPATKWEEFARMKGIRNQKKSGKVWDEATKEWKPRWGYKRANDNTKDWLIEVPKNVDPYEDQFEKRMKEKKERVAKNEYQRLRNIARKSGKRMVMGAESVPELKQTTNELSTAYHHAKKSTASMGKFENKIKGEKQSKNMGKKRKYDSLTGSLNVEKSRQLNILNEMSKKTPTLNIQKAVNKQLETEDRSHEGKRAKGKKPKPKGRSKYGRKK